MRSKNAMKKIHTVELNGYNARTVPLSKPLFLGSRGSYGIEQLQLVFGEGWKDMTVTATFHPPGTLKNAVRVLAETNGIVNIPPEATARASLMVPGQIVFVGLSDGVQRISCNLEYIVSDHVDVEGAESIASPSILDQILVQTDAARVEAKQAASEARINAQVAAVSALTAQNSVSLATDKANEAAKSSEQSVVSADRAEAAAHQAITGIDACTALSILQFQNLQQRYSNIVEEKMVNLQMNPGKSWPFNNKETTVALTQLRENTNYEVNVNVLCYSGGRLGTIRATDLACNGFKLIHDGSATSVKVSLRITGGMNDLSVAE